MLVAKGAGFCVSLAYNAQFWTLSSQLARQHNLRYAICCLSNCSNSLLNRQVALSLHWHVHQSIQKARNGFGNSSIIQADARLQSTGRQATLRAAVCCRAASSQYLSKAISAKTTLVDAYSLKRWCRAATTVLAHLKNARNGRDHNVQSMRLNAMAHAGFQAQH